jgi:hypothetical protein
MGGSSSLAFQFLFFLLQYVIIVGIDSLVRRFFIAAVMVLGGGDLHISHTQDNNNKHNI